MRTIVSVEKIKAMPKSQLIRIFKTLNVWEWSYLLGEKPEGWDEMPNYKKPYMDECETKEDIIRPYMKEIEKIIPYSKICQKAKIFELMI